MFLSNWLVFKIVLAAVTGLVDYPLAADVLLKYDNANKLYLDGNSIDYVSNVVLYKGETSYEIEGPNVIVGDEQKITSSDNTSGDQFSFPVSIDGDYAVCAASQDDTLRKGSAYIFKREGTTWTQQSRIVKDGTRSDYHQFGRSVAISGDYVISGMPGDNDNGNNSGAAYIFKRYGTSWIQMQRIVGTTRTTNHRFGGCVSIDGEYAIVGMRYEDNFKGHASIFKRTGETWTEQIEVESDDGDTTDRFAGSVSISGNYAIVGAFNDNDNGSGSGSAYIYGLNGSTWSLQQKIIADDGVANDSFGWSVAISGEYALVGAYGHASKGCAYIFKRDGTSWTQQAKLISSDIEANDSFGQYVALKGDIAVISSPNEDPDNVSNAGSVYIFKRNGTKWIQQTKFTGNDSVASDNFGTSVAVSNNDVIVGAYINESAYIYPLKQVTNYYITQPGTYRADLQICGIDYKTNTVEVTGSIVPEKSFPSVSTKTYPFDDGTVSDSDYYGYVGLSGNGLVMVIVGKGDDDTTTDSGGFMVYEKINGVWTFTQQITNVGSGSGTLGDCDEGKSVQLDYTGTRVFIGAHADDHSYTNSGSVYIYRRVAQGNWTLEQRIDGGAASYRYGYNDVNNDGDKLMVGSYGYPGSGNVGRAWYYTRSGTSWSLQEQLAAPSTSAYGNSVGMNSAGTRAIIGGYDHSSNKGRVDIWNYSSSSWSIGAGFTGENSSDKFGWNVDMSNDGNTVVVGAPIYSGGGEEGRAYIYTTSDGTNWSLTKTLSNQTANERFGFSVQISGDGNTVVIGAAKNDDGVTDGGRSYVYVKSGGSWPSTPTHTIIGTTANSNNGHTLGISDTGETIVSGAPFDDDKGTNQGAVYIFDKKEIASLTFDNYNKFSLTNTPTYTSSKLAYYSNVYDIGTLTSDITIEKPGEYASLTFDTSSNVAYFSNATVGTVGTTLAEHELEQTIPGYAASSSWSQGSMGSYMDFNGDGTRMVVGMGLYNTNQGRAAVYHLENGSWVQKVDLAPTASSTRFGDSVLMNEDGTRIAVNYYQNSTIKIYEYTNGVWPTSPTTSITTSNNSGKGDMDWNTDGTVIVTGDGYESGAGKTYVYRLSGGTWTETNIGNAGNGVAINGAGTRILAGVVQASGTVPNATGIMYESNYDSGTNTWSILTAVATRYPTYNWPTRIRMDNDGTTAIAIDSEGGGGIYERQSGSSWTESLSVDSGIRCSFYSRGSGSISYDGTMVLLGDYRYAGTALYQGRAFLYEYANGSWSLTKTYENPKTTPVASDGWGYGTAITKLKDRIAIGMAGDDNAGTNYGAIYTYTNAIPDFIDFDGYNKLSLSGITNPTSKIHALPTGAESTTTYDIGTATNIYIESEGTYTAEMKGSDGFALDSNVVGTVTPLPTTDLDIPAFPTNSAPSRTSIPYTNSIGQTYYTGGMYSLTYNGDAYEITVDSEEQGGATYDPITSVWARGWHLFTKIITSEGSGGGTTTDFAQYNSANYVTVPAHVKIKLPSAKVAVGGFLRESRNNHISGFIIQGSNNDSDWTDLYTGTTIGITTGVTFTFSNSTAYQYYRLRVTSLSSSGNNYFRLDEMNIHFFGYVAPPSLTFDGFNKYTFTGADTGSTYKLKYLSNTYDLGTISNVYIANPGTYSAEIKGATNFALSSNTATYQSPFPWEIYNATNSELFTSWTQTDGLIDLSGYTGTDILVLVPKEGLQQNTDWRVKWTFDFTDLSGAMLTTISTYGNRYTVNGDLLYGDLRNDSKGDMVIATTGTSTQFLAPYPQVTHTVLDTNLGNGVYRRTIEYIKEGDNFTFKMNGAEYTDANNPYTMQRTNGLINIRSGTYTGENLLYPNIRINGTNLELSNIKVNIYTGYYGEEPKLDFDGYNKLTLSGLESGSTSNVLFNGNTYSIGTASNVYISEQGTYDVESKGTTTFALTKNVVGAIQTHPNAAYANYRSIGAISAASTSLHNENISTTYSVTMWAKKINSNYFFRTTSSDTSSNATNTHGIGT